MKRSDFFFFSLSRILHQTSQPPVFNMRLNFEQPPSPTHAPAALLLITHTQKKARQSSTTEREKCVEPFAQVSGELCKIQYTVSPSETTRLVLFVFWGCTFCLFLCSHSLTVSWEREIFHSLIKLSLTLPYIFLLLQALGVSTLPFPLPKAR